jgi:hypothetical protein
LHNRSFLWSLIDGRGVIVDVRSIEQGTVSAIRSPDTWFFVLATVCIAAPYLLRVGPKTPRQRMQIAVTIAFLAWILLFMASLRSR